MQYNIAAHPTAYNGITFRSRLEATWAAFFDLNGWKWEYEPVDLAGWTPDFHLIIPCIHSECYGYHELYIEVKPFDSISEFEDHIVSRMDRWALPSPAKFGINPHITEWEMGHGAGGGIENIASWAGPRVDAMWREAGNMTRWRF